MPVKDKRITCPICGSTKLRKDLKQPRFYKCSNDHEILSSKLIPKYKYKIPKN